LCNPFFPLQASGSQLEQLFPSDIMTLLSPSSVLLLTSRDAHAAASLQLPPGFSVLSYNVRPLSDELAVELFCWRAFKSAWPNSQQEGVVRDAVEQCGGLPLAVEAMALACSKGESDPDLFRLYGDGNDNKLFRSLHEAVGLLSVEEQEALQDVAVFFVGADWGAVETYCGPGVLAALERSGLVEREPAGTVGAAYAVEAFCEAVQQDKPGQARLNVEREEDKSAPLVGFLVAHRAARAPQHCCRVSLPPCLLHSLSLWVRMAQRRTLVGMDQRAL
jgi:hypothetical protein